MGKNEVKLHLGCGAICIPGFIHIDLNGYPHIDYQRDIRDLDVFEDNSADLIYASHVLEYFDRIEVKYVLKEWCRVLKTGGLLRVAVPDFEAIVQIYLKYGDLDHQGVLGPLFGKWPYKMKGEKVDTFFHRTTYDFSSFKKVLEVAGFHGITRYNWENTIHKNYDDYSQAYIPHMDKENGVLVSLNIEATKI